MTPPIPAADADRWVVVILGDCGRYTTISAHPTRAEAVVVAEAHAGATILFCGAPTAPTPQDDF
jgi:hypothetical protein